MYIYHHASCIICFLNCKFFRSYYGGMLSIRVRTNKSTSGASETALAVLAHVNLLKRATSLGGTESLIEHRYVSVLRM